MAEYINIEDIPFRDLAEGHNTDVKVLVAFASDIASLPIVEIVRCKDCKHLYHDADCGLACEYTNMGMREDDYCSYGERKE